MRNSATLRTGPEGRAIYRKSKTKQGLLRAAASPSITAVHMMRAIVSRLLFNSCFLNSTPAEVEAVYHHVAYKPLGSSSL